MISGQLFCKAEFVKVAQAQVNFKAQENFMWSKPMQGTKYLLVGLGAELLNYSGMIAEN